MNCDEDAKENVPEAEVVKEASSASKSQPKTNPDNPEEQCVTKDGKGGPESYW